MSEQDVLAAVVLSKVRKKFDTPDHKTFVYQMGKRAETHPERGMTAAQRDYLWSLVVKYRQLIFYRAGRSDDGEKEGALVSVAKQRVAGSNMRWKVRRIRAVENSNTCDDLGETSAGELFP